MNSTISTAQTVLPAQTVCTSSARTFVRTFVRACVRACVRKFDMVLVLSLMAASAAYAVSAFTQLG